MNTVLFFTHYASIQTTSISISTTLLNTQQSWQQNTLKENERFTLDGFEEIRVKRGEEVMVTRFRLLKLIEEQAHRYWGGIIPLKIHIYSVASQAVIWNEIDFQSWLTNTWASCKTSELVAVFEGEKFHVSLCYNNINDF